MVPAEGLEPPLPCENQILSLARLPIPPRRHALQEVEVNGLGLFWQALVCRFFVCMVLLAGVLRDFLSWPFDSQGA
jgi:hypothetical protein